VNKLPDHDIDENLYLAFEGMQLIFGHDYSRRIQIRCSKKLP